MVTDNQKAVTTVVVLATVLLLAIIPFSHAIPFVFADKPGPLTGSGHVLTSLAFASHKQGLFTGFSHATDTTQGQGWYQHPDQQQYNKKWHYHGDSGHGSRDSVVNTQNADCSSTSNANGGGANGGNGGNGNGGSGGSSNGGNGGSTSDSGNGGNGSSGGSSPGGPGGNLPGGDAGIGGSSGASSQTSCSNTSTFHISNAA